MKSQSLSSRAMSFDPQVVQQVAAPVSSQSLSSRAMSFDINWGKWYDLRIVSIPFEQGDVFRQIHLLSIKLLKGLNPFRAGRCLSTDATKGKYGYWVMSQSLSSRAMSFDYWLILNSDKNRYVSIPFEQGDVFRRPKKYSNH